MGEDQLQHVLRFFIFVQLAERDSQSGKRSSVPGRKIECIGESFVRLFKLFMV